MWSYGPYTRRRSGVFGELDASGNGIDGLRPGAAGPRCRAIAHCRRGGWRGAARHLRLPLHRQGVGWAASARTFVVYVDHDFDAAERERIGLALQQWNHVLNGFVRLRPVLLPADASDAAMAQIGHVLGAGHDPQGHLMAPVHDRNNGRCIDRAAVAMVASAQRLMLAQLNWCVGPGLDGGRTSSR